MAALKQFLRTPLGLCLRIKDLRRHASDNVSHFAYLANKNKTSARPSRAVIISVRFFPVLGKSAT